MELKVSSSKLGISPSDCISEPEEKEISDDDDDDRNHKHRRQETRSQSLERDTLEQVITRPYRKWNKPFENGGHPYREGHSQPTETWKNYNFTFQEKDLSAKFEKGRSGLASFPQAPSVSNQRLRINHSLSGDFGSGRGRGRESGSWSQLDSRFSSVDIASQMVRQGSVPPSLFSRRGVSNVSNAQSASWSAYGLVPGIANGGLDTLHSLGFQGTFRPPINPLLSIGVPRQRCIDFEERGFCLRGDMCPMEHGVNRIVVDDVQSLSQFNLPVSLPSGHLMATPAVPGPLPAISASSSTLMNSKGLHRKSSKHGIVDDGLSLNGAFAGSAVANGADLYDPDQPLWTNDCTEASTALVALNPSNIDETKSLLDRDPSYRHHVGLGDGFDNEQLVRSVGTAVGSQFTNVSVWGRMGSLNSRSGMKEKLDSTISSSDYIENETKEDQEPSNSAQSAAHQRKRVNVDDIGSRLMDSSLKPQIETARNVRKPSQKALRTLFVNGIPQRNNKREILLSHFRKFGEVIDIYIPMNSERAFVQFSKREEAEAALKAPDAVMGNRFIKLWWANRDSIPDDGISSGSSVPSTPRGVTVASVTLHTSVANRGNNSLQSAAPRSTHASVAPMTTSDHPKTVISNDAKASPLLQKKLESLEFLKEEMRKKQEMLDKKRNDFRRQLDKLEKQGTGFGGEGASDQAAKRHKVGTIAVVAKDATPKSTDPINIEPFQLAEVMTDNSKSVENVVTHGSKSNAIAALQEPSSVTQSNRPLALVGAPFIINRYKLDNRPTTFRIIPPLPNGLANVSALKEHFSTFGDISTVELQNLESQDGSNDSDTSKCSAHISFTARRSAERAFLNGKCWQNHNLQFMWLTSRKNSSKDADGVETHFSSKGTSDANAQLAEEVVPTCSKESAASGNVESEILEGVSVVECMEPHGDIQSSSTMISCEKQSP